MATFMDDFSELADAGRFGIPARMQEFLTRERPPSTGEQTMSFYSFAYQQGFERLAQSALERWRGGGYIQLPLFYLARHSIELTLKYTIEHFAIHTGETGKDIRHSIQQLWDELNRQFKLADMPELDDWGRHVDRLIKHIHNIDPTGETFRYPHNLGGRVFDYTHVEFKGLVDAHEHITLYCGASIDVLGDGAY